MEITVNSFIHNNILLALHKHRNNVISNVSHEYTTKNKENICIHNSKKKQFDVKSSISVAIH